MFRLAMIGAVVVLAVGGGEIWAGPITSISARNSDGSPQFMPAALGVGVEMFGDRTNQRFSSVPDFLLGADYVQTLNDDTHIDAFELDVELAEPARLYVFVNDYAFGDGNPIPWMADGSVPFTFVDTGETVVRHSPGFNPLYTDHSVWVSGRPAGTSTLLNGGTGVAMYGVAVTAIPEPGSIALLLCGAFTLLGFAWRKKRHTA